MYRPLKILILIFFFPGLSENVLGTNYYLNSLIGKDDNPGTSPDFPFQTIAKINATVIKAGDRILFAAGQQFTGELQLIGVSGKPDKNVVVSSYHADHPANMSMGNQKFLINAKSKTNGIFIKDCQYLVIKNAIINANGYFGDIRPENTMRVGVFITASPGKTTKHIHIDSLEIENIYFENQGFVRGVEEIRTANGTQRYGWGIRLVALDKTSEITQINISHVKIRDVSHTGIKLTGSNKNINWVKIFENDIADTGGPGIQMSEVKNIHVYNNSVDRSGSNNDSRKWGRGSGLWTWGASNVLIEKNNFTNANGPGDSAGAHIDFNCDHVVLQYNFSAKNAGGFCEILGNNYNCAYRYNVSVNDGHRIKGKDGAFQEGKIFWLSGYQGNGNPRKGPVNSYFYNNTIYVDSTITARIAIDGTSRGILIANNIFYIMGDSKMVLGDQYKADGGRDILEGPVLFSNNLFFSKSSWPENSGLGTLVIQTGNPEFKNPGGLRAEDYTPKNSGPIAGKGLIIRSLDGDFIGLLHGMNPDKDILGNFINNMPPIGAIISN
jgi:hypothetical protein